MAIKAKQHGVMFTDYADGGFRNTYDLLHEVKGKDVCFGHIVDTREGRTFYLGNGFAAFSDYPSFEAAYYAAFPERKEADHD